MWLKEMQAGQRAFHHRQLQDAARSFRKATKLQPERAEGWVNLGSALLETGHYAASEKALRRAIKLFPSLVAPQMLLGDVLRLTGRVEDSLAAYRRAVKLERSPAALNKLACALRSRRRVEEARSLYTEVMQKQPDFLLARVNFATLLLECGEFDQAERQLTALSSARLPQAERAEVEDALLSLGEYRRLEGAIESMNSRDDLAPLKSLLHNLPPELEKVDEHALGTCRAYLETVLQQPPPESLALMPLPESWPLVEGLFMIPLIESVTELQQYELDIQHGDTLSRELLESVNVRDAIVAARRCRHQLTDPADIELHLRHWHSLSTRGLAGFSPGHLKYTQNWSAKSPTLKRVEPARSSATLQCFLRDIYPAVPNGLARAAISFLALCDLHCFGDGNGRVALTWINRQLEWNGDMPLLFTRELGMQGRLGEAKSLARVNGGDPTPVITVMQRAQAFARDFCEELAGH